MLRGILILSLTMALSAPAGAICLTLQSLDNENDNCADNTKYVDAGISCFLDFEKQVKTGAGVASEKMGASNKKHVGGAKNSQASGLAGMIADFKISEAQLDALIAAGRSTLKNIDGYGKNIYFPEEWDAPEAIIGNGMKYLNSSPCYAEPRDMLNDMEKRTENYLKELEKAKSKIVAMRGVTNTRDENIDNNASMRRPAGNTRVGKSAPAFKGQKQLVKKSKVTGIELDKAKRAKQPGR